MVLLVLNKVYGVTVKLLQKHHMKHTLWIRRSATASTDYLVKGRQLHCHQSSAVNTVPAWWSWLQWITERH